MKLQYEPCGCDPQYHKRRPRSLWMRLFWTRRLYHCKDCQQYLFIPAEGRSAEGRTAHAPLGQTPREA
jgi:hypothetical protein